MLVTPTEPGLVEDPLAPWTLSFGEGVRAESDDDKGEEDADSDFDEDDFDDDFDDDFEEEEDFEDDLPDELDEEDLRFV